MPRSSPDGRRRRNGRVESYDEAAGYGEIVGSDGRWFFHCTAIAGGGRSIDEGATVTFVVVPGHRGRWEAADVRP